MHKDADLILALAAGTATSTLFGLMVGLSYLHVFVPFNDAFRRTPQPSYTRKRWARTVAHTCTRDHVAAECDCPPRNLRTVLVYQGTDFRDRREPVRGRYPLGGEVPVRISYRSDRPNPMTRISVLRNGIRGAALGAGLGAAYAAALRILL